MYSMQVCLPDIFPNYPKHPLKGTIKQAEYLADCNVPEKLSINSPKTNYAQYADFK